MSKASPSVDDIIRERRSIRAFRGDPVDKALVLSILDVAARAPSGTNMQPWRAYVLEGRIKDTLSERLLSAHETHSSGFSQAEYQYYPDPFFEPYLARRRKVGFDLYGALGIAKGERDKMSRQHGRNFLFFGAPVGLIFTIHRDLKIGSWLDYGMFLENIMIAARGHGLETCVQAAFAPFHGIIRDVLPISDEEVVVCGMSLGYADLEAPENRFPVERMSAAEFSTFLGWDE